MRRADARTPRVILYGKPGCCLCEEALAVLRDMQIEALFELVEVDIESDPALYARFIETIPVIEVDGDTFCEFRVDPTLLKLKLKEVADYANPSQGNQPHAQAR